MPRAATSPARPRPPVDRCDDRRELETSRFRAPALLSVVFGVLCFATVYLELLTVTAQVCQWFLRQWWYAFNFITFTLPFEYLTFNVRLIGYVSLTMGVWSFFVVGAALHAIAMYFKHSASAVASGKRSSQLDEELKFLKESSAPLAATGFGPARLAKRLLERMDLDRLIYALARQFDVVADTLVGGLPMIYIGVRPRLPCHFAASLLMIAHSRCCSSKFCAAGPSLWRPW